MLIFILFQQKFIFRYTKAAAAGTVTNNYPANQALPPAALTLRCRNLFETSSMTCFLIFMNMTEYSKKPVPGIFLFLIPLLMIFCNGSEFKAAPPPPIGGYNVYTGHLHNHTELSGGTGTSDEAYIYARDKAHMDFLGITDHAEHLNSTEWAQLTDSADTQNDDGRFVAIRGFEWSSSGKYGHVAIIDTADFVRSDSTGTDTFSELCDWLAGTNGIAFYNHPGREDDSGNEFEHFTHTPIDNFAGMELWNKSIGFDVYYYNDGYTEGDGYGYYDEALQHGWHTGASGSGDDHYATWGTRQPYRMAVLANAKTREEILAAIRARRFYSTLDPNLSLSFKINGNEMGSRIAPGTFTMEISTDDGSSTDTFTSIVLVKNGTAAETWSPGVKKTGITSDITVNAGEYYYVRVLQADGDEAVSSPIWID